MGSTTAGGHSEVDLINPSNELIQMESTTDVPAGADPAAWGSGNGDLYTIDVEAGDTVETGEQLGLSGNTGRTTGPHLHWAVKWRNPATDDRDADFYIDPALLLALEPQ